MMRSVYNQQRFIDEAFSKMPLVRDTLFAENDILIAYNQQKIVHKAQKTTNIKKIVQLYLPRMSWPNNE